MRTRTEHIAWCKEQALKELAFSGPTNAWAAMASDLRKHPDTADHPAIMLGMQLILIGDLDTPEKMKRFIEGFN